MDLGHVEPRRVRRYDDFVCLRGEVLAGLVFAAFCHFYICCFLLAFALSFQYLYLSARFWTGCWRWVTRNVADITTLDGIELSALSWCIVRVYRCGALIL